MKVILIAFSTLLLRTSCVNGQSVTTDSVLVTVQWLRSGMQDLIRFDQCKEEVQLLHQSNSNLKAINSKSAVLIQDLQEQQKILSWRLTECNNLASYNQEQYNISLATMKRQLRKQELKTTYCTIGGIAVGVGVGIITGIFLFK